LKKKVFYLSKKLGVHKKFGDIAPETPSQDYGPA